MPDEKNALIVITDPQQDRYASLHLIDWWNQDKIKAARVMVVGAGALGNEVLKNLALLGIGYIFIVDFDTIEASNLTRSVLYRPEDGGQSKAFVAAERVRAINADVHVSAFHGDVTKELGTGIYREMDVIIGCLDNRSARMAVNQACWRTKKPWIDGALSVLGGLTRVFVPPDGACYECTMTEQDYQLVNIRYSCPPGFVTIAGKEPTLPTSASIIAAMQVQEAVKLLHGLPVKSGQAVYYSGENTRLTYMSYPRREDCPVHLVYETIIDLPYSISELTIEQFIGLAQPHLKGENTLFLSQDVVTYFYCPNCKYEEAVYRPYSLMVPDRVPCPRCKTLRLFDVVGAFATSNMPQNVTLTQLGIPPLHILPVRSGGDWLYFELCNDKQSVLPNW